MTESLSIDQSAPPKRAYCRTKSKVRTELEEAIVNSHAADENLHAAIFPSGMAAISATFSTIFGKERNGLLLLSDELYCDTPECAKVWSKQHGFQITTFDVCNPGNLVELVRQTKSTTLLFLESCSNPSGKMLDWEIIPKLKVINPNLIVCVDNTWLTTVLFNPFYFGADIVIESMSKFRSKGKLIGGFVCCKKKFIEDYKRYITIHGMFIGADHCRVFLEAEKTLRDRVTTASLLASRVIRLLEQKTTIVCPLHKNHPSNSAYSVSIAMHPKPNLHRFQPSVFLIHVKSNCSLNDLERVVYPDGLKKETSYGAAYSKIDPWPHLGSSNHYDANKMGDGEQGVWLRVSVGYEDTFESLYRNLEMVIEMFSKF